jgi:acetyltransferase
LRDGAPIRLRPISAEDKQLLVDMLEGLSEQSRYWRFFTWLRELTPELLVRYTELDHSEREAIVAIEPSSGAPLGVARWVRASEEPEMAEVAVAVVDDWHHRGVASALLEELSARARQEGIRRFLAFVQTGNSDALRLFRALGARRRKLAGPYVELVLEL